MEELQKIKKEMSNKGISQVDLILKLKELNIDVEPPMMSSILRGTTSTPKARLIIGQIKEVLGIS